MAGGIINTGAEEGRSEQQSAVLGQGQDARPQVYSAWCAALAPWGRALSAASVSDHVRVALQQLVGSGIFLFNLLISLNWTLVSLWEP